MEMCDCAHKKSFAEHNYCLNKSFKNKTVRILMLVTHISHFFIYREHELIKHILCKFISLYFGQVIDYWLVLCYDLWKMGLIMVDEAVQYPVRAKTQANQKKK